MFVGFIVVSFLWRIWGFEGILSCCWRKWFEVVVFVSSAASSSTSAYRSGCWSQEEEDEAGDEEEGEDCTTRTTRRRTRRRKSVVVVVVMKKEEEELQARRNRLPFAAVVRRRRRGGGVCNKWRLLERASGVLVSTVCMWSEEFLLAATEREIWFAVSSHSHCFNLIWSDLILRDETDREPISRDREKRERR